MEEALRFFRTYEVWLYFILGLVGLWYVRKFLFGWQELRGAAFGLERESAQSRVNQSAGMLIFLMALAIMVFILVSFITPSRPEVVAVYTPTLDLLATPSITIPPTMETLPAGTPVDQTEVSPQSTPGSGCVIDQVIITSPSDGSEIQGIVEVRGTVILPNFGFYKLEMRRPGEQSWLTILAGNEIKQDAVLGTWNTSLISPGDYQLGLVAVDNQGSSLPSCQIQVRVATSSATSQP